MDQILIDGFKLLAVGMGMVFLFLFIMVIMVNLVAKILAPFKNMFEAPAIAAPKPAKVAKKDLMQDQKLVSILSEAIKTFQQDK